MANPNRANRTNKAEETTKRCRRITPAPLFSIPLNKVNSAKSDSDFAAQQTCPNYYHFLFISAQRIPIFNALNST